jgi:hypothetical protein
MAKLVTIRVPDTVGGRDVQGYVAWLTVGEKRWKFLLQIELDQPSILTDYRSGYKLANLGGIILQEYVYRGYSYPPIEAARRAARIWLANAVSEKGADYLIERFNSVPALN